MVRGKADDEKRSSISKTFVHAGESILLRDDTRQSAGLCRARPGETKPWHRLSNE